MCLILKYPFWSMLLIKTKINKKQSGRLYPAPTKNIPATPTLCFSVPYSSSPIQGIIVCQYLSELMSLMLGSCLLLEPSLEQHHLPYPCP